MIQVALAPTHLADVLPGEMLSHQPQDVQVFLLRTSILKRLAAPLCDAVLEQTSSQAILDQLEKANLFLVPLDDERRWYRHHHLFAELLRTQLQRSLGAQGIAQLHVRASEWHGQNGLVLEAIEHASMASDEGRVERFIEQNYVVTAPQEIASSTGDLVERLSERELQVPSLVADGLSNQEIADVLILAIGTVKAHVHNSYGKLGVQSRTQAIARVRELSLL